MKLSFSDNTPEKVLLISGMGYLAILWSSLIMAESGIFHPIIVTLMVALVTGSVLVLVITEIRKAGTNFHPLDISALILIVLPAILNALMAHDNFMGGIDPGVMSNAAVYLSRTGSLHIDESLMLLPGLIKLDEGYVVGFHLGYISWLAVQYSVFGLPGVMMGNLVPNIIGLLSIYFICKRLSSEAAGIAACLLFETTYGFIWFVRGTFNEIFSLSLIMFAALCLLIWYQTDCTSLLSLGMTSVAFFMYVRIEAIALFVSFGLLVGMIALKRKHYRALGTQAILTAAFLLHYVVYTIIHIPWEYYALRIDSSDIDWGVGIIGGLLGAVTDLFSTNRPNTFLHNTTDFVFRVLAMYGSLWIIAIFLGSSLWYLLKSYKKPFPMPLLLILYALPVFVYLLTPFTDPWQPWFLKRYIFAIIPIATIISMVFLRDIAGKKRINILLFRSIVLLGLIVNLIIAQPVILHMDHTGAIEQVGEIAEHFSTDDVILVDRSLAGFYKIADPMYYVFGRYALWVGVNGTWCGFDKIDFTLFQGRTLYVMLHPSSTWFYSYLENFTLIPYFNGTFSYSHLEWTVNLHDRGPNYLETNYTEVIQELQIPQTVVEYEIKYEAYRVIFD